MMVDYAIEYGTIVVSYYAWLDHNFHPCRLVFYSGNRNQQEPLPSPRCLNNLSIYD